MQPNQNAIDIGAPTISLAGVLWPVPELALRQTRDLDPILFRLVPLVRGETNSRNLARILIKEATGGEASQDDVAALDGALQVALAACGLPPILPVARVLGDLTPGQRADLVMMGWIALRQAHPDLTLSAYLDMPVRIPELLEAYGVITMQASNRRRSPYDTGEATGAKSPQVHQTTTR